MWKEIIKVRADRRTLYMRLPREWTDKIKVGKGTYLTCQNDEDDNLVVMTLDKVIRNAKKISDGKDGANR